MNQQVNPIKVIEKIRPRAGQTRYCTCENEKCQAQNHAGVCMANATLVVEAFGQKQQLCNDCLCFAQSRYNANDRDGGAA